MSDKRAPILLVILVILVIAAIGLTTYNVLADGDSIEMVPSFTRIGINRTANGFVVLPIQQSYVSR